MNKTDEVYDYIYDCITKRRYSPTVREIGDMVHLDSTSSVAYHLEKLEKLGRIVRNPNKNRAIELTEPPIDSLVLPVVGEIAAGQPILAEENLMDKIVISDNFFTGSNLFCLKVKGESMIDAGIFNGDYVVINKQPVANNGEIVACLIDNDATVKRFYKENGFFRLQPENSAMSPIFTDHVEVLGKVVGLIRNKF